MTNDEMAEVILEKFEAYNMLSIQEERLLKEIILQERGTHE